MIPTPAVLMQDWHPQDWCIVVEALDEHLHPHDPLWRQARIESLIADIERMHGLSSTELICQASTDGRYLTEAQER
ncbi:hypothetical protein [Halalkalirubrum salinum]|uniref:hypothetical protein n=1 Tax=Halalkalirubrum salinum TaxID=2563889 RepID=UPI0010FBA2A9|nr:hypothetical protein [Halalkalirubrum salinum]